MLDKLKVRVTPPVDSRTGEVGKVPTDKELYEAMLRNGWGDEPGVGRAILTPDGREILNPMPVAPPIGYVSEPSMMDRLNEMLAARMRQVAEADQIESIDEVDDFDVPDPEDFHPSSVYEVEMVYEAPALKPGEPSRTDSVVEGEVRPGASAQPQSGKDGPPAGAV